jgi:hypothetical protein
MRKVRLVGPSDGRRPARVNHGHRRRSSRSRASSGSPRRAARGPPSAPSGRSERPAPPPPSRAWAPDLRRSRRAAPRQGRKRSPNHVAPWRHLRISSRSSRARPIHSLAGRHSHRRAPASIARPCMRPTSTPVAPDPSLATFMKNSRFLITSGHQPPEMSG